MAQCTELVIQEIETPFFNDPPYTERTARIGFQSNANQVFIFKSDQERREPPA